MVLWYNQKNKIVALWSKWSTVYPNSTKALIHQLLKQKGNCDEQVYKGKVSMGRDNERLIFSVCRIVAILFF